MFAKYLFISFPGVNRIHTTAVVPSSPNKTPNTVDVVSSRMVTTEKCKNIRSDCDELVAYGKSVSYKLHNRNFHQCDSSEMHITVWSWKNRNAWSKQPPPFVFQEISLLVPLIMLNFWKCFTVSLFHSFHEKEFQAGVQVTPDGWNITVPKVAACAVTTQVSIWYSFIFLETWKALIAKNFSFIMRRPKDGLFRTRAEWSLCNFGCIHASLLSKILRFLQWNRSNNEHHISNFNSSTN